MLVNVYYVNFKYNDIELTKEAGEPLALASFPELDISNGQDQAEIKGTG